jgi:hypothetical protein
MLYNQSFEFEDEKLGVAMMINFGSELWLFQKHGGDQWLSIRKCTSEDLNRLSEMIHRSHGPVLKIL